MKVIDKKSINAIKYERELLSNLNHTLIINMHYAFQDYDNLYLVLDLLTGGDLRYQISRHQRQFFSENQTKFFISCLIESLFYIHSKQIIHRDIKPENLIFDENGYLHITDFGIAKYLSKNNSFETSGTPGYMAPEVMMGNSHNFSVDFYAVGVITYELMMGKRPYSGKTRKEIKEQIMGKQAKINKNEIPEGWSFEAVDFTNKLLIRKDIDRLGYYNENLIKEHPWLKDVDMNMIKNKKIKAPFLPKKNHDNYDKNYCEEDEEINFETYNRFEEYKLNKNYKDLFIGFTYYNINENIEILKSKTLIIDKRIKKEDKVNTNIKALNEGNNIEKNYNNIHSSEKMNKSLKLIHQRYNSNMNIDNNLLNMNYSLSKILSRKNMNKIDNEISKQQYPFSPKNNIIHGYDTKGNKDKNNKKVKRAKSFTSNILKKEKDDNSYIKLLHELNYKNENNNYISIEHENDINNDMMKLSTNFYLPNTIKNEKKERPKSISNLNDLNINVILDKKSESKNKHNNKIKKLNTNKHFYKKKMNLSKDLYKNIDNNINNKKRLNKNYSQGNIQSKLNNNHKSIVNEIHHNYHKSLSKTKNNKIDKNKTLIRNTSLRKKNLAQKKIPMPITSGKKITKRKLDPKIKLNLIENNNNNCSYSIKNFASTTKGRTIFYTKKNENTLCKNLLNELSFNNNDNIIKYNIQPSYNTINVEERKNNVREYNKSINTDLLFSLKKVNSFKNLNSNHKKKLINNSTKLIKNKIKIKINDNDNINKNNLNYMNNTNYKFKIQKKNGNNFNDSDNKSQMNSKIISFANKKNNENNTNFYGNIVVNNNRSINNKNRILNKNILMKGKIGVGNYSYQSIYSTASTGQTKVYNK